VGGESFQFVGNVFPGIIKLLRLGRLSVEAYLEVPRYVNLHDICRSCYFGDGTMSQFYAKGRPSLPNADFPKLKLNAWVFIGEYGTIELNVGRANIRLMLGFRVLSGM
jgi:hypothetical protein